MNSAISLPSDYDLMKKKKVLADVGFLRRNGDSSLFFISLLLYLFLHQTFSVHVAGVAYDVAALESGEEGGLREPRRLQRHPEI